MNRPSSKLSNKGWFISKRVFDFTLAFLGLALLLPVMTAVAAGVAITSSGPVLFVQPRVGQHGRIFRCIKFRTMRSNALSLGTVTTATDTRITPFGRFLRKWKLDELPQLWNVFVGNMSLVGPRPDVPGYADTLQGEDRLILELRPGITGPASLLFKDEEIILAHARNPLRFNNEVIYPAKVQINKDYARNCTFLKDLGYIVATIIPGVSSKIGLCRWLKLDIESFRNKMIEVARSY